MATRTPLGKCQPANITEADVERALNVALQDKNVRAWAIDIAADDEFPYAGPGIAQAKLRWDRKKVLRAEAKADTDIVWRTLIKKTREVIEQAARDSEGEYKGSRPSDRLGSELNRHWNPIFERVSKLVGAPTAFISQSGNWNSDSCSDGGQSWMRATQCLRGKEPESKCPHPTTRVFPNATKAAFAQRVLTQKILNAVIPEGTMTAYRGSGKRSFMVDGEVTGEVFLKNGEWHLPVRPLSSWSLDKHWAANHGSCLVQKEIPINRIAAFSPASYGMSGPELEIVVEAENGDERIPLNGVLCRPGLVYKEGRARDIAAVSPKVPPKAPAYIAPEPVEKPALKPMTFQVEPPKGTPTYKASPMKGTPEYKAYWSKK